MNTMMMIMAMRPACTECSTAWSPSVASTSCCWMTFSGIGKAPLLRNVLRRFASFERKARRLPLVGDLALDRRRDHAAVLAPRIGSPSRNVARAGLIWRSGQRAEDLLAIVGHVEAQPRLAELVERDLAVRFRNGRS